MKFKTAAAFIVGDVEFRQHYEIEAASRDEAVMQSVINIVREYRKISTLPADEIRVSFI